MIAKPTNIRPAPDQVIADIAAYVDHYQVKSNGPTFCAPAGTCHLIIK